VPTDNHRGREAVRALARGLEEATGASMVTLKRRALFRGRVSDRVAKKLVAAGIASPEQLLFMTKAQIQEIPGMGKTALEEIAAYRVRFMPHHYRDGRGCGPGEVRHGA
jgi:hypothetical protein